MTPSKLNSLLGVAKQGWIGADLGAAAVKVAQVTRRRGSYSIAAAALVDRDRPWETDPAQDPVEETSADALLAGSSLCNALSGRDAAAVVSMSRCEHAAVKAPTTVERLDESEVRRRAAVLALPGLDSCQLGWWPGAAERSGDAVSWNLIGLDRDLSDRVAREVVNAGWDCRLIDAMPWCLARAVGLVRGADQDKTFATLDIGYDRAVLCLVQSGRPVFVRALRGVGLRDALGIVRNDLGLDAGDADLLLRRATEGKSRADTASPLDETVLNLADETARTLAFWRGKSAGLEPGRVWLFGGGALLPGVAPAVAEATSTEASVWSLPFDNEEASVWPAPLFGAAAGLSALAWSVGR
ncbi:Competence protein A [Pseudobythopirellula maris]|uniref:Competence protein A n=1 Tax=Pseudobythopirellula maris TaxID=2527991 RepID=A0A5C5ZP44_9BACT|nr:pilus assembly protein PilM [Pseudobythopirellula maris]TWT88916.1 Competence protein A [Pseudobythopirellula maris]